MSYIVVYQDMGEWIQLASYPDPDVAAEMEADELQNYPTAPSEWEVGECILFVSEEAAKNWISYMNYHSYRVVKF